MRLFNFTLIAVVEVRAYTTLVSNTLNGADTTVVTSYPLMDNHSLVCSLFTEVINKESLEGLGGIALDLLSQDLHKLREELIVKDTCGIASSARQTLLVDLSTVASEAGDCIILFDLLFLVF